MEILSEKPLKGPVMFSVVVELLFPFVALDFFSGHSSPLVSYS